MKFGAVYCQTGIGYAYDQGAIRDYIQTVEDLEYDYLLIYDLLTDTDASSPPMSVSEPFSLLNYAAAITTKLELVTGVLVLPSRQTMLVAKQAAELDLLSGGRTRLGVSVGWNESEYTAMGVNFSSRGERIEEQVKVLRELWTKPEVNFKGKYHSLEGIGIHPLPVQRPIPIWFGGHANATLRRVAQMGDGWLAYNTSPQDGQAQVARLHNHLETAGRKPEDVGIGICVKALEADKEFDVAGYRQYIQDWHQLGATHCDIELFRRAEKPIHEHIKALQRFKEEVIAKS